MNFRKSASVVGLSLACGLLSVASALAADSGAAAKPAADHDALSFDVVIYGACPAGVTAAVAAASHGHTVALVERHNHVGGVVSGGLTSSDLGDVKTIGGLAADFFARINQYYRDQYGPDSKQVEFTRGGAKFEPHVAELVYERMLAEQPRVTIFKGHRFHAATVAGDRVATLVVDDLAGQRLRTLTASIFIDASYEGDLLAAVGVPYRVGREARAEFDEYLGGVNAGPKALLGSGDQRTQAYNYRVSITSNTANRVLCPKPDHYTPEPFAAAEGRAIKAGRVTTFLELYSGRERSAGPNDKFDSNWCDFIGNSVGYADGDWTTRERIEARQRDYVLSRLYYLQNDPDLPAAFRADAQNWGLPKDEFADNGHFPFQLYVREARRMVGRYVLCEDDLTQHRSKSDGVCAGSYGIDCHMVQSLLHDGKRIIERTRHVSVDNYDIPYPCLTPYEP
ncbi:MAG TPA: FAD-dependent oxidoreductase, partial [Pirellulales bacterium]|nr:FAD-dependent oxidoreductase [Pirellulales bacterium]